MQPPRVVSLVLLVAAIALANRYTPGMVQAVLVLVILYLAVTHAPQVGAALTNASAGLARGFGTAPARAGTPGGARRP